MAISSTDRMIGAGEDAEPCGYDAKTRSAASRRAAAMACARARDCAPKPPEAEALQASG